MQKSIFDLDENIVGALSYLFGPLSGILVLVLERDNKFVRFHALQATIWFVTLMAMGMVVNLVRAVLISIPLIGGLFGLVIAPILLIGSIVYWGSKLLLIYKAYEGAEFKLPIIGDVVWKQINK